MTNATQWAIVDRKTRAFALNVHGTFTRGYMTGQNGGVMQITEAGQLAISGLRWPLPAGKALVEYWLRHPSLDSASRKALAILVENPAGFGIQELAAAAGYQVSGGFRNALSALRTAGVLVGRNNETMKASDLLLQAMPA